MATRAILFDLFDTLVDLHMEDLPEVTVDGRTVRYSYPAVFAEIVKCADVDFDTFASALRDVDRRYRERQSQGFEVPTVERFGQLAERLALDHPDLPLAMTEAHMEAIRSIARSVEGHREVLDELGRRFRLAVCSNFTHSPMALRILEEAGLRGCFDEIVISDEVGLRKPRREIFDACLERLEVSAAETVHVGDSLDADVRGASDRGIRAIWLTRRVADSDAALRAYDGPAPSAIVADLSELCDLL